MASSESEPDGLPRRKLLGIGTASGLAAWSILAAGDAPPAVVIGTTVPGAIDVRSLGAKGDGTTDDTKAIQRALDLGTRIFIPPGNYRITAGLKVRTNGTVVQGASAATTRIFGGFTGEAMIANVHKSSSTLLWCQLLDLAFVASGAVRSVIDWRSMQFGEINRCWIYGSGATGQAAIDCGAISYGAQECTFNRFQDNYIGNVQYGYRAVDGANANHISGGRVQLDMPGSIGALFKSQQANGINGWTIIGFCCEHPGNRMTGISFEGNVWDIYVAGCRFEQLLTGISISPGNRRITLLANAYSSNHTDVTDRGAADDRHMIVEADQLGGVSGVTGGACGAFHGRDGTPAFVRGASVRKTGVGAYLVTLDAPMATIAYGVLVGSDCPMTKYRVLSSSQFAITTFSSAGGSQDAGPGVTFSVVC